MPVDFVLYEYLGRIVPMVAPLGLLEHVDHVLDGTVIYAFRGTPIPLADFGRR
jgi:hypothetical protein